MSRQALPSRTGHALGAAVKAFEMRRDIAARALANALSHEAQGQQKLRQLEDYSNEVLGRWSTGGGPSIDLAVVRQVYAFLERLGHARDIQVGVLERLRAHVDASQAALSQAKIRLRTVELLVERRQSEQQRLEERAQQRATDETAARYPRAMQRPTIRNTSP